MNIWLLLYSYYRLELVFFFVFANIWYTANSRVTTAAGVYLKVYNVIHLYPIYNIRVLHIMIIIIIMVSAINARGLTQSPCPLITTRYIYAAGPVSFFDVVYFIPIPAIPIFILLCVILCIIIKYLDRIGCDYVVIQFIYILWLYV